MPRETVADLLLTGPLPPEHGARLGMELAFALHRAAGAGTWPRVLRPDRIEVDQDLRPILTDLVPGAADLPALGIVLRAVLGEGDPVPLVLQVVTMRARQGRYGSADQVGRALRLWLATQDPPRARLPWLRSAVAPVRPGLAAVGVVIALVGAGRIAVAEVPAGATVVVIPPGSWPAPPVPIEVEGVVLSRGEASAALALANGSSVEELRGAGLSARTAQAVVAGRPYDSVDALALVPGLGPRALAGLTQRNAEKQGVAPNPK